MEISGFLSLATTVDGMGRGGLSRFPGISRNVS